MMSLIVVGIDGSEESKAALPVRGERGGAAERETAHRLRVARTAGRRRRLGAVGRPQQWLREAREGQYGRRPWPKRDTCSPTSTANSDTGRTGSRHAHSGAEARTCSSSAPQDGSFDLLLGSVSQQVAQHANCPVVIVPHRERPLADGRSVGQSHVDVSSLQGSSLSCLVGLLRAPVGSGRLDD